MESGWLLSQRARGEELEEGTGGDVELVFMYKIMVAGSELLRAKSSLGLLFLILCVARSRLWSPAM